MNCTELLNLKIHHEQKIVTAQNDKQHIQDWANTKTPEVALHMCNEQLLKHKLCVSKTKKSINEFDKSHAS